MVSREYFFALISFLNSGAPDIRFHIFSELPPRCFSLPFPPLFVSLLFLSKEIWEEDVQTGRGMLLNLDYSPTHTSVRMTALRELTRVPGKPSGSNESEQINADCTQADSQSISLFGHNGHTKQRKVAGSHPLTHI